MTARAAQTSSAGGGQCGVATALPEPSLPTPSAAAPRRGRKSWRSWWLGLGGVGGLLLLATLYGWRYGFTELPAPPRESALSEEALFAPFELPATNFWHPLRTLARAWMQAARAPDFRAGTARFPGASPLPAFGGSSEAVKHLSATTPPAEAELEAALQAALAAPDRRPPRELQLEDGLGMEAVLAYLDRKIAAALEAEDPVRAFEGWVLTWQLHAALVPAPEFAGFFDERGLEMLNATLAAPFRRQVLKGPPLTPAAARRILTGLAEAGRRVAPPAEAYARQVLRLAEVWRAARVADWSRVSRAARVAGMLIRQDAVGLFGDVLDRVSGWRRRSEPNYHGAAHLLRPLGELVAVLQISAARAEDFDRMERACLAAVLGSSTGVFTAGSSAPAALIGPGARPRTWWQRALDRPAVWRLPRLLPPPGPVLESWQQWRLYLESCRLTLALRMYRDQHGHWPDRLDALVPEWLEAVPEDPFAPGTPLRYSCAGDSWQFWSAGGDGEAFAGLDRLLQRVFRSTEFDSPGPEPSRRSRR